VSLNTIVKAKCPDCGAEAEGVPDYYGRLVCSSPGCRLRFAVPKPVEAATTVVVDSTSALLQERGKTHGDYTDHARITSRLKDVIYDECTTRVNRGQQPLTPDQRETLDMISHKVGRILAGQANFRDHWDDIAGYARLSADRCLT
jgi:hypothetical protein